MNPDPFEQHLQRRALPPLPPEWRAEILGAAAAAREEQERAETPGRGIPWKHARWGALAAVWVGILTIRQLDPMEADQSVPIVSHAEILQGLEERQRLLAEFAEEKAAAAHKTPTVVPRHRSGFHSLGRRSYTTRVV